MAEGEIGEVSVAAPAAPAGAAAVARIGFDFCFRLSSVLPPPLAPGLGLAVTGNFLPSINASNRRNSSISETFQNQLLEGRECKGTYNKQERKGVHLIFFSIVFCF